MTLFQNKYRIKSARLSYWDYASDGWYFITICVKDRVKYFGDVHDYVMELNKIGLIANECWKLIPKHFKHVILDEYVVMPNHIHGIIIIDHSIVETQNFASLPNGEQWQPNKFAPQSKNLGSIIRGFKIGVKKYATMNEIQFQWQPRFYDHIIRDQKSLDGIRQYIYDNPEKWELDRNNSENLWM